jgi:SAM-dependent methyltransferase
VSVTYGLDQSWYGERDRLRSLSALFDATTLEFCGRSGLREGAHVLELGAGAGSVAEAMADRVGSSGRVVAVDRDTRFLRDLGDRVEVREMDLLREPLPAGPFDLVHARLLLGHLGDPLPVLKQWLGLLRPGSWLVVEDLDTAGCDESIPPAAGFSVVARALFDELARRGFDQRLGLRLPALLSDAGLAAVEAITIRPRKRGDVANGLPAWDLFGAQLAPALVAGGRVTPEQHAEFTRATHDPGTWLGMPALTTARGRRPTVASSQPSPGRGAGP